MKLKLLLLLPLVVMLGLATLLCAADAREVAITANDAMQFSLKEITAKPGETLTVKLTHIGKLPKTAMGHNWVLLKAVAPAEIPAFANKCMQFAPEYLPKDSPLVLAHTKVLGGGESDSVTFTVPAAPGEYPFLCTFPGHFAMMNGKLIVK